MLREIDNRRAICAGTPAKPGEISGSRRGLGSRSDAARGRRACRTPRPIAGIGGRRPRARASARRGRVLLCFACREVLETRRGGMARAGPMRFHRVGQGVDKKRRLAPNEWQQIARSGRGDALAEAKVVRSNCEGPHGRSVLSPWRVLLAVSASGSNHAHAVGRRLLGRRTILLLWLPLCLQPHRSHHRVLRAPVRLTLPVNLEETDFLDEGRQGSVAGRNDR